MHTSLIAITLQRDGVAYILPTDDKHVLRVDARTIRELAPYPSDVKRRCLGLEFGSPKWQAAAMNYMELFA